MSAVRAPSELKLITGEALQAMGDIGPCELIDGRIVPMSPTGGEHGVVEFNLGRHIGNFVADHQLGWVMGGEVGIYIRRSPDRIRAADIAFVSKERSPDRPPKGFLEIAPELVVEIMSPDDRWQHIRQKLEDFFSIGVKWVWIVEPENKTVLVYHAVTEMEKFDEDDTLAGEGELAGFSLAVASLFAE